MLDRRLPVGVDNDNRVGLETIEYLTPKPAETGDQADLLAVVQLASGRLVEHDGGSVADEADANDFADWKVSCSSLGTERDPNGVRSSQVTH